MTRTVLPVTLPVDLWTSQDTKGPQKLIPYSVNFFFAISLSNKQVQKSGLGKGIKWDSTLSYPDRTESIKDIPSCFTQDTPAFEF